MAIELAEQTEEYYDSICIHGSTMLPLLCREVKILRAMSRPQPSHHPARAPHNKLSGPAGEFYPVSMGIVDQFGVKTSVFEMFTGLVL